MSNPFDQFIGSPIDWDNILNMSVISEIAIDGTPEQMLTQIRASSIDPNDLVGVGGVLAEMSFRDHGKVALEEAIRQLDSSPSRIAADINLVHAKRNVCMMCMPSAPLESFQWLSSEPQIIQVDPGLALKVAVALSNSDHYEEAEAVLQGLDKTPQDVLAGLFPDAAKGIQAIKELRVSVRGTLCRRSMPADPLAAFEWIKREPSIVHADPKPTIAIAWRLWKMGRFDEASAIFGEIDKIPTHTLHGILSGSELGIEEVDSLRAEIYKHTRFNSLPPRWDMGSGDVDQHIAVVEDGLQRRIGLGQADTLVNLSALAVSGDRRGIPLFVRALSNHKRDIQTEAALALHLHGDPRGLRWLLSENPDEVVWALRIIKDPTAARRVAEWDKAKASQPSDGPRGTQSIPTEPKKAGGCFVATAACGDPFAPEVIVLSAFRDDVLSANGIGRASIRVYYAVSPPIAAAIARSALLRQIVRASLILPATSAVGVWRKWHMGERAARP